MDGSMSRMLSIWNAGLDCVRPDQAVLKFLEESWCKETNTLTMEPGVEVKLKKNLFVVGFGKSTLDMAEPLYEVLADHLRYGMFSVPRRSVRNATWMEGKPLIVQEGAAHGRPDYEAMESAKRIAKFVGVMKEDKVLIVLISEGGSALLPLPEDGVPVFGKSVVIRNLKDREATLEEINVVNQALSKIKAGGLAEMAAPAKVLSLILSDVVGDPLNIIAGGPTFRTPKDYERALNIVQGKLPRLEIPKAVLRFLTRKVEELEANPPPAAVPQPALPGVLVNKIIGSNQLALEACKSFGESLGIDVMIVSSQMKGEACDLGWFCADLARCYVEKDFSDMNTLNWMRPVGMTDDKLHEVIEFLQSSISNRPKCVIFGGETKVTAFGNGHACSRNQEMALNFTKEAQDLPANSCYFLSASTDGLDGPTHVAGAFGYAGMFEHPGDPGLNVYLCLRNQESHMYYANFDGGSHVVKPGRTGTNVKDIQLLYFPA